MNQLRRKTNEMAVLLALLLLVGLYGCLKGTTNGGCNVQTRLNSIDESYKREFYKSYERELAGRATNEPGSQPPGGSFAETHSLIKDFVNQCENKATEGEMAHVMVLDSLAYLQAKEFVEAERAITLAESHAGGAVLRDKTLIRNLPHIIDGLEVHNKVTLPPPNHPLKADLKNAIDTLDIVLTQLDSETYDTGDKEINLYLTYLRSYLHRARALAIADYGDLEYERDYHRESGEATRQIISDYDTAISTFGGELKKHMTEGEFTSLEGATDPAAVSGGESVITFYKQQYVKLKIEKQQFEEFI